MFKVRLNKLRLPIQNVQTTYFKLPAEPRTKNYNFKKKM